MYLNRRVFVMYCAWEKSYPGVCSPLIQSIVSNDSVSGQRRPRSGYADAQADLGLCCLHMPKDMFWHGAAHVQFEKSPYMNSEGNLTGRDTL